MTRISTNQIALGTGAGGALQDVSSYVEFDDGVTYDWGKEDEFRSQAPARLEFQLNNYDGRFTPGNASSPLTTKLTEGMPASWLLGGRLFAGQILAIQPLFEGNQASWARVNITVEDALGIAARTMVDQSLADSITKAAGLLAFWRMDGDSNDTYAEDEVGGLPNLALSPPFVTPNANPAVLFGAPPVPGIADHTVQLTAAAELNYFTSAPVGSNLPYPQDTLGAWGYWIEPGPSSRIGLEVWVTGLAYPILMEFYITTQGNFRLTPGQGTAVTQTMPLGPALYQPHYIAFTTSTTFSGGVWTIACSFYVDGALVGTSNYVQTAPAPTTVTSLTTADRQPSVIRFIVGDGSNTNIVNITRLSHTLALSREDLAVGTTEASRLLALEAIVPDLTFDTLPTDLSPQPIGSRRLAGSVLDAINDVIKTEQGYMWSAASGTLTSPTPVVKVRARNRPTSVTASFDVDRELANAPSFIRDVTNMVARIDVTGSTGEEWSFYDGTVSGRVGSGSISDDVLNSYYAGVEAWAQDRLMRGRNTNLRIASAVVDAMTTPTDRSAAILALKPGDRVRFTNLPSQQLGTTTWDGWFLGGHESHAVEEHKFTLYFQPVLSITAGQFDTATFDSATFVF